MMHTFGHFAAWLRASAGRTYRSRPSLSCEMMETRALMAATPLANLLPETHSSVVIGVIGTNGGTSQTVLITNTVNPKLIAALHTFLADLEQVLQGQMATSDATATLQNDLNQIAVLAGTNDSRAVARLNTDVTNIAATGTITPVQRPSLISDLEAVLIGAGVPGTVVVTAANQALGPMHSSTGLDSSALNDIADPNALGTPQAGQTRGQDGTPTGAVPRLAGSTSVSGDGFPESGLLGRPYRKLMDDLKGVLAKAKAVSPAQKAGVRADFAGIAMTSHRPDDTVVSTLRQDLDAIVTAGQITDDGRSKITHDLGAVLQSAGVSNSLADRTLQDLAPVINAQNLSPIDLKTLLGDLVNLLIVRPKAIHGF